MSDGSRVESGADVLRQIYRVRFDDRERAAKAALWRVLCRDFLQRYVDPHATVVDLACGYGEFLRFVRAGTKHGIDLNPEVRDHLPPAIEFHLAPADELPFLADDSVDVVFASNFFEHLPDKGAMDRVLAEARRVLRPGGSFLALQPNIRYAYDRYWDFYDHHLPLSHLSAAEGFAANGFEVRVLIPRFMPWSTKTRLPRHPLLLTLYLRLPLLWRFFGKQFFIVAQKPARRSDP